MVAAKAAMMAFVKLKFNPLSKSGEVNSGNDYRRMLGPSKEKSRRSHSELTVSLGLLLLLLTGNWGQAA
jgi:hypothetical protein